MTTAIAKPEEQNKAALENSCTEENGEANFVEYTIEGATATQPMRYVTYACLVLATIAYAILVVYLAIYGFSNPDPRHCYFIKGLDTPALSKSTVLILARDREITVPEGYPLDISHLFRAWFVWGFWGTIYQIIILAVFLPLAFTCTSNVHILYISGAIAETVSCCNTIAWLILGFIWRYSSGGGTCSGDKLE